MIEAAEKVAAARSLLGTPWFSHARLPGIDCIGVPIVSAWICGLRPRSFDIQGYSLLPDGSMLSQCDEHMVRLEREEMSPGDVGIFQYGSQPHHMGVIGDYRHGGLSLIHAENYRHMKVIEHRLWLDGVMKFVRAYRIEELPA